MSCLYKCGSWLYIVVCNKISLIISRIVGHIDCFLYFPFQKWRSDEHLSMKTLVWIGNFFRVELFISVAVCCYFLWNFKELLFILDMLKFSNKYAFVRISSYPFFLPLLGPFSLQTCEPQFWNIFLHCYCDNVFLSNLCSFFF